MKTRRLMSFVLAVAMIVTMASFPAFAEVPAPQKIALTADNLITCPAPAVGTVDKMVDGTSGSDSYARFFWWAQPMVTLTENNVIELDLGDVYHLSSFKIAWGHKEPWGDNPPDEYRVYYAGADKAYKEAAVYTGIYEKIKTQTLPENMKGDIWGNDPYMSDIDVTETPEQLVRYIKIEINKYEGGGVAIREIEAHGIKYDPNNYVDYTVKYVDENGTELAPSKTGNDMIGRAITETAVDVDGYMPAGESTMSFTLTETAENNVIEFVYIKAIPTSYVVKYQDESGNNLLAPVTVNTGVLVTDVVTETARKIDGYNVDAETKSLKLAVSGNEIVFVYTPTSASDKIEVSEGNVSATFSIANGSLKNIIDGDIDSRVLFARGWADENNGVGNLTDNNVIEIDLGDEYAISRMDLAWSYINNWGEMPPDAYTVYYAGADKVYNVGASYTDLYRKAADKTLPDNMTLLWWNDGQFNIDVTEKPDGGIRYIKIEISKYLKNGVALREFTVYGTEYVNAANSATLTIKYVDNEGREISAPDTITKTKGKTVVVTPKYIDGYKADDNSEKSFTLNEDMEAVFTYVAVPQVASEPAAIGSSSVGAASVPFIFDVSTPANAEPAEFAKENWTVDNCTISSVNIVSVDNPDTFVYEWKVTVNVAPAATGSYAISLTLPAEYERQEPISIRRTPSPTALDSAIMEGDNILTIDKTEFVVTLDGDGKIKDKESDRTALVTIDLQTVMKDALPYKGYDNVVVEIKEITSGGKGFTYKASDFVKLGNKYYGNLLATELGVDKLYVTLALYGVNGDSKAELSTVVLTSPILSVTEKDVPAKTDAEYRSGNLLVVDVLDQLIAQVHPLDLPVLTDSDWAFYEEALGIRGTSKSVLDELKTRYEAALVAEPTGSYDPDIVISLYRLGSTKNTAFQVDYATWNILKDLHIDSFTFDLTPIIGKPAAAETDLDGVKVTFRNGIDYDRLNYMSPSENGHFCLGFGIYGATNAGSDNAVKVRNAYNAVRRALDDDQIVPVFGRLNWDIWRDLPFTGAVMTYKLTEDWIENYGAFHLAAYHMQGYEYDKDNTPVLKLLADDIKVENPVTREVSFEVPGSHEFYDPFAVISTNKLPSELPEIIGTYYEVE